MSDVSLAGMTLHVANLERSIEFYLKIPGAALVVNRPGNFAMIKIGENRLGLLQHSSGQFHIELETDDLDGLHKTLIGLGIDAKPPTAKPWGEVDFLVVDPDGYTVEFGTREHDQPATSWPRPE